MKNTTTSIINDLIRELKKLQGFESVIQKALVILTNCYASGKKVLICGNGGSAADAMHVVGELMKGFILKRPLLQEEQIYSEYINKGLQRALPAISLVSETALMTAYTNDCSADLVFAQQVYGYGVTDDVLIALSTSGNSENILYAAEVAKGKGMSVISLTGKDGGKLKILSDVSICVPETEAYKIQELHLPIYHALCKALENEFFGEMI